MGIQLTVNTDWVTLPFFSLGANSHDDTQGKTAFEITVDIAGVRRKIFKKKFNFISFKTFLYHEPRRIAWI